MLLRIKIVLLPCVNNSELNFSNLANKYGTPLYVYDASTIIESYTKLKHFCGETVDIFYSLKANPNKSIVKLLNNQGASTEVCSSAELENVLSLGVHGQSIIFVGPYKSDADIIACLKSDVYAIVFESFHELFRINKLATQLNLTASVIARINPEFKSKDALLKMGGTSSQFGIDQSTFYDHVKSNLKLYSRTKLIGIHVYNGTRILNVNTIIENTKNIFNLASDIQQKFNIEFKCVDIGGGVGVPYFDGESEINLLAGRDEFQKIVASYLNHYPKTKVIMESGRYLVAKSGTFISKIQDIKKSKGKEFLITDGGTNCHMAAIGVGSAFKRNFPIYKIPMASEQKLYTYEITGPLCTPNDLIAKAIELSECSIGELICISNSGAYGPTASPVYFLSHGFPTEVMIYENHGFLIRDRDYVKNINDKQINIFNFKEL